VDQGGQFLRERLCGTFKTLSQKVWNLLYESRYFGFYSYKGVLSRGLNIEEDTITDIMHLELNKKLPLDILTVKFSKPFESREGVDCEWWLLSASGIIGFRIQAKKLHHYAGKYIYEYLDYKTSSGNYQVDNLITYAQNYGVVPLYIFYNWWDSGLNYRQLVNSTPACKIYSTKNLGITVADAFSIKQLVVQGRKEIGDVLAYSWPIHCLFCSSYSDLSDSVSRFLKTSFEEKIKVIKYDRLPERVFEILKKSKEELKDEIPNYLSFIMDPNEPHKDADEIKRYLK
jgi:hypothetical protein